MWSRTSSRILDDERGGAFELGLGMMMVENAGGQAHAHVEDDAAGGRSRRRAVIGELVFDGQRRVGHG